MVQHADIDHTGITGVGGALTVENEGTPLATSATTLDFVGAGVTASGTGAEKTITIAGGGGSPNYTSATVTGGNKTLNSTSITEVDSALRLTLAAVSGDLIEYGWIGLIETNANPVTFDAYTHDGSNNRVNPFGAGLSASAGSTLGVPGWYGNTSSTDEHQPRGVPVHRTLVSGDIQSGNVTVGFWYVKNNTNARTLFATTNIPLKVWMRNLGQ